MTEDHDPVPALDALVAAAARIDVARRLDGDAETALLQGVVDAAATIFDAEASSLALFERDPDRLQFRVAAGAQGKGVVGVSVPPTKGIVGYVFSTVQPIALSDVMSDPRFDKATAQRTGYVPRAIAGVPLVDRGSCIGVLQVLDKRSSPTFTLRDLELMGVFARQAAAAIEATRVQREASRILGAALRAIGDGTVADPGIDAVLAPVLAGIDRDAADPFWRIVDQVARIRALGERERTLLAGILEVVAREGGRSRPGTRAWARLTDEE